MFTTCGGALDSSLSRLPLQLKLKAGRVSKTPCSRMRYRE